MSSGGSVASTFTMFVQIRGTTAAGVIVTASRGAATPGSAVAAMPTPTVGSTVSDAHPPIARSPSTQNP
jgi:hypothetical protein